MLLTDVISILGTGSINWKNEICQTKNNFSTVFKKLIRLPCNPYWTSSRIYKQIKDIQTIAESRMKN